MQSELVSRGPLSVLINAKLLQFYHSGVWSPVFGCNPDDLDHGRHPQSLQPLVTESSVFLCKLFTNFRHCLHKY